MSELLEKASSVADKEKLKKILTTTVNKNGT